MNWSVRRVVVAIDQIDRVRWDPCTRLRSQMAVLVEQADALPVRVVGVGALDRSTRALN